MNHANLHMPKYLERAYAFYTVYLGEAWRRWNGRGTVVLGSVLIHEKFPSKMWFFVGSLLSFLLLDIAAELVQISFSGIFLSIITQVAPSEIFFFRSIYSRKIIISYFFFFGTFSALHLPFFLEIFFFGNKIIQYAGLLQYKIFIQESLLIFFFKLIYGRSLFDREKR